MKHLELAKSWLKAVEEWDPNEKPCPLSAFEIENALGILVEALEANGTRHKHILRWYIAHVGESEGVDFIDPPWDRPRDAGRLTLSVEDQRELFKLAGEGREA